MDRAPRNHAFGISLESQALRLTRLVPPIWFALDETRPLACFAGTWTCWASVRKLKEGETTNDVFAFLTTEPNAVIGAYHPKAMPVILTTQEEIDIWMGAPAAEALALQRPLSHNMLTVVARGAKQDGVTVGPEPFRLTP